MRTKRTTEFLLTFLKSNVYVILQVGRLDEAIVHTKEILDKGKCYLRLTRMTSLK